MRHLFTALCTRALIDQTTQSTSLIELIDGLYGPVEGEGVLPVALDLISIWARDDSGRAEIGNARVSLFAPDGQLLGQPVTYEVDLRGAPKMRNLTKFPGFPVRGTGTHRIVVEKEGADEQWEVQADWPVIIAGVAVPTPTNS